MTDTSREVVRRVVVTALLVLAGALVWLSGTYRATPTEPSAIDSAVEQLIPSPGSPAAVRQAEIGIDLGPGWTGTLVINGVEIPPDQLRRNEPLNQFFFRPAAGRIIEALPPGPVTVTAIIWRPVDGQTREQGSRTVTWEFRVA